MNKLIIAAIIATATASTAAFAKENDPRAPKNDVYSVFSSSLVMGSQPEIGSRVEADLFSESIIADDRLMGDPGSKQ